MGSEHYEPIPETRSVDPERVDALVAEVRDLREELAAEREVRRADVARLEERLDQLTARIEDIEASIREELDTVGAAVEENSRWRRTVEGAVSGAREQCGDEAD